MDRLIQDVRYAVRALLRRPAFTIVAVLTLAVGIGANTAIFSVVNATLLRKLPFAGPDRLVTVTLAPPATESRPAHDDVSWSYPKYLTLLGEQRSFSDIATYSPNSFTLSGGEEAERIEGEFASARYVRLLGIQPLIGRGFLPEEDAVPGKGRVALIGEGLWNRRYNASRDVLGQKLVVDENPYTIVGVLPASFRGLSGRAEVWVPVTARAADDLEEQWAHFLNVVARLKPGIGVEQARADLAVIAKRVDEAHPDPYPNGRNWGAQARLLEDVRIDPAIRRSVIVLFLAVGGVLLIACVNVANLLLARAATRRREIAVRLAIGAGRHRLIRQLLTESAVLSLAGALAGLALGALGVKLLTTLFTGDAFASRLSGLSTVALSGIRLDTTALLYAIAAALLTGLLFGIMPALQTSRVDLTQDLKDGAAATSTGHTRRWSSRNVLVISELALAVILLVGSGLMIRSLGKLLGTDAGFDGTNVVTMRVSLPQSWKREQYGAYWQQLLPNIQSLPGVESASISDCPPLAGGCNGTIIWFRDRPEVPAGAEPEVGVHLVTPSYFPSLRVPLKQGRLFDESDRADAPKVVLINEAAARAFYPGENPVGRIVGVAQSGFHDRAEIIGVVGNERFNTMEEAPKPDVFISYAQAPRWIGILFIRATGDPHMLIDATRREVHALDRNIPVYDVKLMEDRVADATARTRFTALLLGLFAVVALALAAVGIYGVVAFSVAQRTREIGIRVALGAARIDVVRLVLRQGAALTAAGLMLGLAGAWASTRLLRSMLYETAPTDVLTFVLISVLLVGVALVATLVPALRAARVDPLVAFKTE